MLYEVITHVADEFFVSWYINNTYLGASGSFEMGEAEINCQPSFLFFRKTVGIDACECLYKKCFSVINMTCSADDIHLKFPVDL